jgi:serine/threonine-protein kinase
MGVVYRAQHIEMNREVAVKLLSVPLTEEAGRRFEREARAASRLAHPGCVRVDDFGLAEDGAPYLVMELVRGHSLAEVLRSAGRLDVARALRIADELLCAMDHAHREGVVHRDLKPENVMLAPGDQGSEAVKILDFGLARLVHASSEDRGASISDVGRVLGTPEYLSPEQALGEPTDPRTDVYAIGVMAYEMLAGRRPFAGTTKHEVISAHLLRAPPSLCQLVPELPPELDVVVRRALEKRKDDRWQTALELRDALRALRFTIEPSRSGGVPREVPPPGFDSTRPLVDKAASAPAAQGVARAKEPHRKRWLWRRPWHLGGLVALVLALLVVISVRTTRVPLSLALPFELAKVQRALDRRVLVEARKEAEGLVVRYPRDAAAFVLLGDVLFADRQVERGLAAYREAVRLDPRHHLVSTALVGNVRATLGGGRLGEAAFALAESLGPKGALLLEEFARASSDPRLARRAEDGARRARAP